MQSDHTDIEKQRHLIRGYLGQHCRDAVMAEDLTRQTLHQACQLLPQFAGERPLSAWVLMIANDILFEHYKQEIEKQHDKIRGYFGKQCRNAAAADDLTQETLYQACRSLRNFRGDCSLSTWVHKIAANLWKKYIERDPSQTVHFFSNDPAQIQENILAQGQQNRPLPEPESVILSAMVVQQLLEEMKHCCSPEERRVVSMCYQGESLRDIADLLEEKPANVRSQFLRGRGKLLAHLVLNGPELLGGEECIAQAYQAALQNQQIDTAEAAAWNNRSGRVDDFRSACLKMAKYLKAPVLMWLLEALLFRHF